MPSRNMGHRILDRLEFHSGKALLKFSICLILAIVIAFIPEYKDLHLEAQAALFILLFAAGLWVTEAISAFAVALLVMALEIWLLGQSNFLFEIAPYDWKIFVAPWSGPLIWLFFGGFILAKASSKTNLDRWLSRHVLKLLGDRPSVILLGIMSITFVFSMFMSNTATTVMMLGVVSPLITLLKGKPFSKAILLAIPFAANIGGMGTIIGSPPNAIAAGALGSEMNFYLWMKVGVPPAIILGLIAWIYLLLRYPPRCSSLGLKELFDAEGEKTFGPNLDLWKKLTVMAVFFLTVALWLTGPIHNIPTPVISFIPIAIFSMIKVIDNEDIRSLHWDVLLLLAGGLSLGVMLLKTGLAVWLIDTLALGNLGVIAAAFAFSYVTCILSNFMSNTAAANIIIPIGAAAATENNLLIVVPVALGASLAMCLPISTPPNAIAFSRGDLETKDFIDGGILMGLIGPIVVVMWCLYLFR